MIERHAPDPGDHHVSHYRLGPKLGGGGMGVVYRAVDMKLDRPVALKFLPPHLSMDEEAKARFIHEAKTASALDHPNICTIYEIDEAEDGRLFIAMACYEGETLKEKIDAGPLPIEDAVHYAAQMAEGLGKAHAYGIVHRDVKPANVMVTNDGQVKLLDFGLAKATGQTQLTREGSTAGTVGYMSPEQARGEAVDHRTDIWSLGVVLYELFAGRRPFDADYETATIYLILNETPRSLIDLRPELPAPLAEVVERALRKNPDDRYQSIDALLADLRPYSPTASGVHGRAVSSSSATPGSNRLTWVLASGAAVFLLGVLGWLWRGSHQSTLSPSREASVAVLPFENLSADEENEYFSDGITEELLNALGRVGGLRVPARTSVFAFKDRQVDLREIGQALQVDHVLQGSVRRAGDRLRIRAELSEVGSGLQLWSETYDREMADIFAVQEEIAQRIVERLRTELAVDSGIVLVAQPTDNLEAYHLYLRGRYFWNRRTASMLKRSRDLFQQALDIDPTYAKAWAGLADAYALLGNYGSLPPAEAYPRAKEAAMKALELDPGLAEAHTTLALVHKDYYWDWKAAAHHFRRAIELDPNYATGHHQYAVEYLSVMGRHEEAIQEGKQAVSLDPLSLIINADLGRIYYSARQPERAIEQLEKTLEIDPNFFMARLYLGITNAQQENYDAAITTFQRAMEISGDSLGPNPNTVGLLGFTYAEAGREAEARRMLDTLHAMRQRRYVAPYWLGLVHGGLGEMDEAFAWFDSAYADRNTHLLYLNDAPALALFRADPRAADLLARMGLSEVE